MANLDPLSRNHGHGSFAIGLEQIDVILGYIMISNLL